MIAYVASIGVVALMTGISYAAFGRTGPAEVVMVYLLGVVLVSLRFGFRPAALAALFSVLPFDFVFVPPYLTLAVAEPRRIVTFAVMSFVAIVIAGLQERARQRDTERLRSMLLRSISHDLRTPLAVIKGAASALIDDDDVIPKATRRDLATAVVEETDRLDRLVRNLLQMTRLETGAVRINKEWHRERDQIHAGAGDHLRLGTIARPQDRDRSRRRWCGRRAGDEEGHLRRTGRSRSRDLPRDRRCARWHHQPARTRDLPHRAAGAPSGLVIAGGPLVLVVEDEAQVRRFLRGTLTVHGYRLMEAQTAAEALAHVANRRPEVVLLDLGLPDIDGLEVTKRLREWTSLPIIVISARGDDDDKVRALDAGADDYLTKPFSVPELLARIRVALRHASGGGPGSEGGPDPVFRHANLRVDLAARQVFLGEHEVHLTPTGYRLLTTLVRSAGRVVTHRQLLREVWGPPHVGNTHYLRVYMAQLRHKLEPDPGHPRLLLNEAGVGYRLNVR